MGVRGELFSTKVFSDKRTYFFNVKENRLGDVFLTIVESKKGEAEEFERHQIVVYGEEMDLFMQELKKAATVVQKHKLVEGAPSLAVSRPRRPVGDHPRSNVAAGDKPARKRSVSGDRPERKPQVPTYELDGEWKGPEAMKAKGGKVARISRKEVEARAAKSAAEKAAKEGLEQG